MCFFFWVSDLKWNKKKKQVFSPTTASPSGQTGSQRLTDRLGKPRNKQLPVTMGPLQSSLWYCEKVLKGEQEWEGKKNFIESFRYRKAEIGWCSKCEDRFRCAACLFFRSDVLSGSPSFKLGKPNNKHQFNKPYPGWFKIYNVAGLFERQQTSDSIRDPKRWAFDDDWFGYIIYACPHLFKMAIITILLSLPHHLWVYDYDLLSGFLITRWWRCQASSLLMAPLMSESILGRKRWLDHMGGTFGILAADKIPVDKGRWGNLNRRDIISQDLP